MFSAPLPVLTLCQKCLSNQKQRILTPNISPWSSLQHRAATGFVQNYEKREAKKKMIWQYASPNTKPSQSVWAWGLAESGALAIPGYLRPESKSRSANFRPINFMARPARVRHFEKFKQKPLMVACGYGFSLIAVKKGSKRLLMGSGVNSDSQLGYHLPRQSQGSGKALDILIEPTEIRLPVNKPEDLDIVTMACGRAHSVIVTGSQGVLTLGNNAYGQCGRAIVEGEVFSQNQNVNKLKDLPQDIIQVVCGQDHTLFLTSEGHVWACGMGADGQTGLGHYQLQGQPQRVKGELEGRRVVSVGGKGDCSLAVTDSGEVFGWGNSEYSQLATGTSDTQINKPVKLDTSHCGHVVKAVAGGATAALINAVGEVYVWGWGVLGKGPNLQSCPSPSLIPQAIFGKCEISPEVRVIDIDCGLTSFVAKTDQGDLYSWGRNNHGCLGLSQSPHKNQYFPLKIDLIQVEKVSCGVDHMIAICKSII